MTRVQSFIHHSQLNFSTFLLEADQTRARADEVANAVHLSNLFSLDKVAKNFKDPILIAKSKDIGAKIGVAERCEHYLGLGQDIVALCINEVIASGAEPLFFLDYISTSDAEKIPLVKIRNGMVSACDAINCALFGGEIRELGLKNRLNLAGFAVGVVERSRLLGPHRIIPGDVIIGISSSGLHTHGYEVVEKIIFNKLLHKPHDVLWQTERGVVTVADELLLPSKIYANPLKHLQQRLEVHAVAPITDGGLWGSLDAVIPSNLGAVMDFSSLAMPKIFSYVAEKGDLLLEDMVRSFNMGIGLALIVPEQDVDPALEILKASQETAHVIGQITHNDEPERLRLIAS